MLVIGKWEQTSIFCFALVFCWFKKIPEVGMCDQIQVSFQGQMRGNPAAETEAVCVCVCVCVCLNYRGIHFFCRQQWRNSNVFSKHSPFFGACLLDIRFMTSFPSRAQTSHHRLATLHVRSVTRPRHLPATAAWLDGNASSCLLIDKKVSCFIEVVEKHGKLLDSLNSINSSTFYVQDA